MPVNISIGRFSLFSEMSKLRFVTMILGIVLSFAFMIIGMVVLLGHDYSSNQFEKDAKARAGIHYKVIDSKTDKDGRTYSIVIQAINAVGGRSEPFLPCSEQQQGLKKGNQVAFKYFGGIPKTERPDGIDRWECYVMIASVEE